MFVMLNIYFPHLIDNILLHDFAMTPNQDLDQNSY